MNKLDRLKYLRFLKNDIGIVQIIVQQFDDVRYIQWRYDTKYIKETIKQLLSSRVDFF